MAEGDSVMEELWRSYAERETKLWSWERELLATIAELLHAQIRQQYQIWGAKKHEIPEPLIITRPHLEEDAPEKEEIPLISFREFMTVLGV